MIIVSQDKSKITQRLEFYIQENFSTDEELRYEIRSIGGGSFGGYKTEERAKEVLKEIIRTKSDFEYYKHADESERNELDSFMKTKYDFFDVYEMPGE